jgi:hypothetical protein
VRWFGSQADKDIHESCPCCRHEANEHEGLPEADCGRHEEEESEDSLSDEDSEEESDEEPEESEASLTFNLVSFRNFCIKNSLAQSVANREFYAAMRIQTVWRAYLPRMEWNKHKRLVRQRKLTEDSVANLKRALEDDLREEEFHRLYLVTPRDKWRTLCAVMIQTVWRGYFAKKEVFKKAVEKGQTIRWLYKDGYWQRTFLLRSEVWHPSHGLPPQSLEFQNHRLWSRVQAVWRGFRERNSRAISMRNTLIDFFGAP